MCLYSIPPLQLADQWDGLHRRYGKRLSSRRQSNARARSSGANSAHSLGLGGGKSDSFTASFPSSEDSTPSQPDVSLPGPGMDVREALSQFDDLFSEDSAVDTTVVPSYISVERKVSVNQSKFELSESDIIDPEILVPKKKSLPEPPVKPSHLHGDALISPEAPAPVSAAMQVPRTNASEHQYDNYKPRVLGTTPPDSESKVMDAIVFLANPTSEYDNCAARIGNKAAEASPTKASPTKASPTKALPTKASPTKTVDISARYETALLHHMVSVPQETTPSDSSHEYANVEFGKNLPSGLQAALNKGTAPSKSSPSPNSAKKPIPIQRKRNQFEDEEKEAQPSKSPPKNRLNSVVPKKPLPPVKPLRPQTSNDSISSGCIQSPEGVVMGGVNRSGATADVPIVVKTRPHSSSLTETTASSEEPEDELSYSLGVTKPRSYTNVDQRPDLIKKEPLLPPATPLSSASNLIVFGQSRRSTEPVPPVSSNSRDPRHAQARDVPQVTSPPSSSRDPPQRSKVNVIAKPLPPSKAKVITSSSTSQGGNAQPPATVSGVSKPPGKSTQVNIATKSKATPPPKPSRAGLSRAGSGGGSDDDTSPMGRSELMRKLSQRRMRIEEQIAGTARTTSPSISDNSSNHGNTLESVSERNSGQSSSSSLSEVVVAYHAKKADDSGEVGRSRSVTSPNGAPAGGGRSQAIEELEESSTLAKFGIIEDVSGGSYVI